MRGQNFVDVMVADPSTLAATAVYITTRYAIVMKVVEGTSKSVGELRYCVENACRLSGGNFVLLYCSVVAIIKLFVRSCLDVRSHSCVCLCLQPFDLWKWLKEAKCVLW